MSKNKKTDIKFNMNTGVMGKVDWSNTYYLPYQSISCDWNNTFWMILQEKFLTKLEEKLQGENERA